jgi:hypothetical protein
MGRPGLPSYIEIRNDPGEIASKRRALSERCAARNLPIRRQHQKYHATKRFGQTSPCAVAALRAPIVPGMSSLPAEFENVDRLEPQPGSAENPKR